MPRRSAVATLGQLTGGANIDASLPCNCDCSSRCNPVLAIDKLRRDNAVLEKTIQALQGLIQMTKGRKCFGPL